MKTYYSHGKLLLSGEYAVLDGALGLAVPTRKGQYLEVAPGLQKGLHWNSLDEKGKSWFEVHLDLNTLREGSLVTQDTGVGTRLTDILREALKMNPKFLNDSRGYSVTTRLEFPVNWGLGSSSTLINNLAQWAGIDAYELLKRTFGGSGYDIACAQSGTPLLYQLKGGLPVVREVPFNPPFADQLFFVFLNRKQDTRQGIRAYRKRARPGTTFNKKVSALSTKMTRVKSLEEFGALMRLHEELLSAQLDTLPIQDRLFADFQGSIKSLGAWGGDFILVTARTDPEAYFREKGYETFLRFKDMVL